MRFCQDINFTLEYSFVDNLSKLFILITLEAGAWVSIAIIKNLDLYCSVIYIDCILILVFMRPYMVLIVLFVF